MFMRVCEFCGKEFQSKDKNARFHNNACYWKSRRTKKFELVCGQCGKTFRTNDKGQIFCSPKCENAHKKGEELKEQGQNEAKKPKIVSKWWMDECPFHNGQLRAEDMANMPDWYFV